MRADGDDARLLLDLDHQQRRGVKEIVRTLGSRAEKVVPIDRCWSVVSREGRSETREGRWLWCSIEQAKVTAGDEGERRVASVRSV